MSEQITPHQLGDHVGREVEMTMRGRIVDAASPCIVNAAAGGNWYPSALRAMEITITLLPAPVPDEPPVGTVVRKVSTGEVGVRHNARDKPWKIHNAGGFYVGLDGWDDWIKPGDEIEIAEWVKP